MKKKLADIILLILLFAGVSLLLYPTVSNCWNSFHQSRVISSYKDKVKSTDDRIRQEMLEQAVEYNSKLVKKYNRFHPSEQDTEEYDALLNVSDGVMGSLDIPKLGVHLPVYHGTSGAVLQAGIGHIEGSSLPVGGTGTHCALSGHRGLPSSKLLTDLDQMETGDYFMLQVLGETLTYQVDQIVTVEPTDLSQLEIDEDEDYCTLITCTPYGINTHRIMVRGRRVPNLSETEMVVIEEENNGVDWLEIMPLVIIVMVAGFLLWLFGISKRKKQ